MKRKNSNENSLKKSATFQENSKISKKINKNDIRKYFKPIYLLFAIFSLSLFVTIYFTNILKQDKTNKNHEILKKSKTFSNENTLSPNEKMFLLFNNVKISVVQNDITKENSEAIVNAANNYLKHGGGVAGSIVFNGGRIIQEESNEIIEKKGIVETGKAVYTSAGKLNAKYIIHTVGPIWSKKDDLEKELLFKSIINTLEIANNLNVMTISIPAISSGIFGFPKKLCAKILLDAAFQFIKENKSISLKNIRWTNFDSETVINF